jgi:hypothetical protein
MKKLDQKEWTGELERIVGRAQTSLSEIEEHLNKLPESKEKDELMNSMNVVNDALDDVLTEGADLDAAAFNPPEPKPDEDEEDDEEEDDDEEEGDDTAA